MADSSPHQLFLLADHLKLSLLERQRAQSLNLPASQQDSHIQRSLSSLEQGIESISSTSDASEVSKLRKQYQDLYAQFHGSAPPSSETTTKPNDPSLSQDFDAAQSRPTPKPRNSKSVRFQQDSSNGQYRDDPEEAANRAALFSSDSSGASGGGNRYRDDPDEGPPDQSGLSNQQIHSYHKQVLRDQDEQLDTLGASIGRQRVLGIEMGRELDEQVEMLDHVEAGVDRHQSTLDRARNRLGHVARKSKDNWSWVTIGILIVILVLVIVILK